MTKTMVILAVLFVICLLPHQVFYLIYVFKPLDVGDALVSNSYVCLFILCSTKCCVNPFIYAVKYLEFKTGMQRICACDCKIPSAYVTMETERESQ